MDLPTMFRALVRALDAAGIPYMVAGSVASTAHGMPRSTQDLDLVIDPPAEGALEALLADLGGDFYYDPASARQAYSQRGMFNLVDRSSGWKADLIIRKLRPFSGEEFRRRQRVELFGVTTFIATAEDVIISKLDWSRQAGGSERQRRDVAGIVATAANLDRSYIARWVKEMGLAEEWRASQPPAA